MMIQHTLAGGGRYIGELWDSLSTLHGDATPILDKPLRDGT